MRRSTRAALAEIPMRLGMMRVSPPPSPLTPFTVIPVDPAPNTPRYALTPNTRVNTPASMPSSAFFTPSPDEQVIQQRGTFSFDHVFHVFRSNYIFIFLSGRKRMPITWSPDIDSRSSSFPIGHTPPKSSASSRIGAVLRSSPKKRFLLTEFEKVNGTAKNSDEPQFSTPTKTRNQSPSKNSPAPKKLKIDNVISDNNGPLDVVLKGLSHEQLVEIIKNAVQKHPELEKEVRSELPLPDLKPFEEKLLYLKRNIFRSLPSSRLTSKTDSPAYARAATHLIAFKKHLVDQGRVLVESQHWQSVLEYSCMSWTYVKATPLWDNHPHNVVRRQCFKYLTSLCMNALKKGRFEKAVLKDVYDKMEGMACDNSDIELCMKWIDKHLE